MTNHPSLKLITQGLLISQVAAHGYIQGFIAGNTSYQGYRPAFQYQNSPPQLAAWSDPRNLDNGFISNYSSPDIICHLDATPGETYATIQAGDSIQLQWTPWPAGHLGPILTYLANCNGECTNVDKNSLLFNKIDEVGLISSTTPPRWAVTELVANNNTWSLNIPSSIAPGNYVLRNEIIALHDAEAPDSAQNYPQCINLRVTGRGNDTLSSGTLGTQLYNAQDPGLYIDIYNNLSNYTIPGPPLHRNATTNNMSAIRPFNVPLTNTSCPATIILAVTETATATVYITANSTSGSVIPDAVKSTTNASLSTATVTDFVTVTVDPANPTTVTIDSLPTSNTSSPSTVYETVTINTTVSSSAAVQSASSTTSTETLQSIIFDTDAATTSSLATVDSVPTNSSNFITVTRTELVTVTANNSLPTTTTSSLNTTTTSGAVSSSTTGSSSTTTTSSGIIGTVTSTNTVFVTSTTSTSVVDLDSVSTTTGSVTTTTATSSTTSTTLSTTPVTTSSTTSTFSTTSSTTTQTTSSTTSSISSTTTTTSTTSTTSTTTSSTTTSTTTTPAPSLVAIDNGFSVRQRKRGSWKNWN